MTPIDFLVNDASYRDGLYMCDPASDSELVLFKFAALQPEALPNCQWDLVATKRNETGAQQFDARLRSLLSLYTSEPQGTSSAAPILSHKFPN